MAQDANEPAFFGENVIRRVWHRNTWYYAIVDIIGVLTESPNPATYWRVYKKRLKDQGAYETLAAIDQVPLRAKDHRLRQTDVATRETVLRLIQTIPSPRAEPFRLWLAQVGDERIAEVEHPERAVERIRAMYRAKGYDESWIEQRLRTDMTRNELTDEWQQRGAKEGREYAILTNEISQGAFALTVAAYKSYKELPVRANLRDHMTVLELALLSLGEATAITLHRDRDSQGFPQLQTDARDAGEVAGEARRVVEARTGRPVVTTENFLPVAREHELPSPPTTAAHSDAAQLSLFDEPAEKTPDGNAEHSDTAPPSRSGTENDVP